MIRSLGTWALLFFLVGSGFGQLLGSHERAAFRHLRKKRWQKAEVQLRQAVTEDTASALSPYLFALYFFQTGNPAFHVDSAYQYTLGSIENFERTTRRQREKIKKYGLDSIRLVILRHQLDSAAFEAAKQTNTEQGYIRFLNEHPRSAQHTDAIGRRNEVAYLRAVEKNTYTALQHYLDKYPHSAYAAEARQKYDRLLYESFTQDKQLRSFENFLSTYPETPFRNEIEQNIFELSTLGGDPQRFLAYLQRYPKARYRKKARDILFHILREQDEPKWPPAFLTDSLQHILSLESSYLVPFLKNGKFGFLNKNGAEILQPWLTELPEAYRCGNITDDIIQTSDAIYSRNGSRIHTGSVDEMVDLGAGFLKIRTGACYVVIHKSGFVSSHCVQDAKVLGNRFIAYQHDNTWSVYSLSGRKILDGDWRDISLDGDIMTLKNDRLYLSTVEKLLRATENNEKLAAESVDEIKKIENGLIWVKSKEYSAILDQKLNDFIPFDIHELSAESFGIIARSQSGYQLYNWQGRRASLFQNIIHQPPWLAVKNNGDWMLINSATYQPISSPYDSIKFQGPFAIGVLADTLVIHFTGKEQKFIEPVVVSFIPGKDSTSFLIIDLSGRKTIYDIRGNKLFSGEFDHVAHAGLDLFIVSRKEKKGVVNSTGKSILPIEYDAVGSVNNQVITLLKNMKFGLLHASAHKLIKPQYDKNLTPYNYQKVVAFRDGFYGLIKWDGKPDTKFEFEEIKYWNDTTAFVKQGVWKLYDLKNKSFSEKHIDAITMLKDSPQEKLAIVNRENAFGVISDRRGTIIPISFTDLVNVGSRDEPLYFTEKHVAEASIFIVIYYDASGKMLRRYVYEEAEDYEKIYCSDN